MNNFILNLWPVVYAAEEQIGCGEGLGVIATIICDLQGKGESEKMDVVGNQLNKLFSGVISFLTLVAALWFAIQFIIAGFNWINAGGDKNSATAAFQRMTNAIVGLLIVVAAWVIIGLIGKLIGLDILNPGAAILNITL